MGISRWKSRARGNAIKAVDAFITLKVNLENEKREQEALKRELVEELKIETEIGNYIETSIYEYPNVTVKLMAYFATVISGEIKLSVHDEAKWISISEVENFKFAPADIPFIEKLKEVL